MGKSWKNIAECLLQMMGLRHICLSCKTKVEKITEKVKEIRTQWEKKGEAGKQELTVVRKRVLSLDGTRGAINPIQTGLF